MSFGFRWRGKRDKAGQSAAITVVRVEPTTTVALSDADLSEARLDIFQTPKAFLGLITSSFETQAKLSYGSIGTLAGNCKSIFILYLNVLSKRSVAFNDAGHSGIK